jgi:PKD repeat protein
MLSKSIGAALFFLVATFIAFDYSTTNAQAPAAIIYSQPPSSSGGLLQSSWWAPDESNYDRYVWDNFTLQSTQAITETQWRGGYDPARFGSGGPVIDFTVAIYASIPGGSQPDVINPPLVEYQTGGNAGQTPAGTFGGTTMYDYQFTLPTPFQAAAGTRYWVQIVAAQHGIPDWGLAAGTGGNGSHFRRAHDVGDIYQFVPGDAAFILLGPPTPISGLSATNNSPTVLGQATTFTATVSAGNGVSYAWNFGDQTTDSGQVVTHTYAAIGSYTAVVTATNSLGSLTATTAVTVTDAPISGLTASNDGPTLLGSSTTLSANVATGSNVAYEWSFGDGGLGSGRVVTHVYPHAGLFTTTITATNSASGPLTTTTVVSIVSAEEPIGGLSAANDSPTLLGGMTTLTASVTSGSSVAYAWNLGDGQVLIGKVVTHRYARFGTFTAIVTATNSLGQMSAATTVTITAPYHTYLPVALKQFSPP